MKRSLLAAAVALALGAGLFACSKQNATNAGAAASNDLAFAEFAPADAILTLAVPDIKRARAAWKSSAIYQIWNEPEMQAFLTKPLAKIPQSPELNSLCDKLEAIQARNMFLSFVSFNSERPQIVAGLAFKGDAAALEPLLAKPKAELLKQHPDGKAGKVPYGNRSIETFETKRGLIATVLTNGWYFASTDLAALKAVLDRVDAKPEAGPALAKDADFKASMARIPAGAETIAFLRAKPVVDKMLSLSAATGRSISEEQKAELQKVSAVVATTGFDKGRLRDTLFVLAPGLKKFPAKLALKGMPFTSGETMLFGGGIVRWPDDKQLSAADPGGQLDKTLAEMGLDLKTVRDAVGNEVNLQADWPSGALYPAPLLSVDLKDRAAALKVLAALTAKPPSDGEWQAKSEDGVEFRVLVAKKPSAISPTVAVTGSHVLAGLTQMDVRGAIARAKGSGPHLDGSAGFKAALADVGKPEIGLYYLDAKSLFEKLYGLSRNFSAMAQDAPPVKENVDLDKLPQTETIAKHLSPVVWSAREVDNGVLCESVGPLTLNQMLVTGAGLGALGAAVFKGVLPPPGAMAPPKPPKASVPPPGSAQPDSSAVPPPPPPASGATPKPGG